MMVRRSDTWSSRAWGPEARKTRGKLIPVPGKLWELGKVCCNFLKSSAKGDLRCMRVKIKPITYR